METLEGPELCRVYTYLFTTQVTDKRGLPNNSNVSSQHYKILQIMSQSMDTPALFDASPSAGPVVNLLRGATGHGSFAFGVWEEPGPWALDFPIGAQFGQQALGKQGVAVFVALALVEVTVG